MLTVRRALARPQESYGPEKPLPPRVRLTKEIADLAEHRDQDPGLRRDPFDRDAEIEAILEAIRSLAREGGRGPERPLRAWLGDLDAYERTRPRDHDGIERELTSTLLAKDFGWGEHPLRARLERFRARADADLAFCLARDLAPALRDYEARKHALGVLDHLDALLRARALLASSRPARLALRKRYRFLFVDEVQDVDPVQKDIVLLLAGSDPDDTDPARARPRPGSLYLVGDPKQAIYGFRRADLRTYVALKEALVPAHADMLELGASFRPRPAIAALVNRAFAGVFDGAPGQARYVALEPQRPAMGDFPSVIALPSPVATIWKGSITKKSVRPAIPDAIASFLRWLLDESGLEVEDPVTRERVPVAPRHVGILFKTLHGYEANGARQAEALERHGVPHAFLAPEAFFAREVVLAASALLSAIEWPDDALSVYATLRGPLLGVPDADLLAFRDIAGHLHPLADTVATGLSADLLVVRDALALLGALHRGRHGRAIEATLGAFLERCEAEVYFALTERPGEARALEQLRRIARRFDVRGASFRDLARWIGDRVEDPRLGGVEVPSDPDDPDTVSVLTVHRAKGLEFPVVVLGDPATRPLRERGAGRYVDPARSVAIRELAGFAPIELREHLDTATALERAEAMRLLYVGATRARDVLVVPTVGHLEIESSWMTPLARALVPDDPRGVTGSFARLPPFGERTMLEGGPKTMGVRPGHHAAHLEGHGVTYWDPQHLLRPTPARDPRGVTHLVDQVEGRSALEVERAWEAERTRVLETAALGSLEVRSARALARTPAGAMAGTVDVTEIDLGPAGAEGARFARLVAQLASEPGPDLEAAARARARALGATGSEREAALAAIAALRLEPTLAALLTHPDARPDVPYTLATDAGPVAWGRIAWVAPADAGLAVVGVCVGASAEVARTELSIAATALERARNQPVRAYLARLR